MQPKFCTFCGSEKVKVVYDKDHWVYRVSCEKCGRDFKVD